MPLVAVWSMVAVSLQHLLARHMDGKRRGDAEAGAPAADGDDLDANIIGDHDFFANSTSEN